MKCKKCGFENLDGTRYCQRCGQAQKVKAPLFGDNVGFIAGAGSKGTSIAPLVAVQSSGKTQEGNKVGARVKVNPMEDGRWYCPDCGEVNEKISKICKGCGRDK